ncbi:ATP-binding cassette domain-containing protein [Sphingomonas sp. NPDC092331]|jgi:iron complex transport system ATP-binding protein|uniref:ABC transporter ATP-binding protein n=1 Tax=unclassified Sphingomonas TaxID=196159 RepID=UPI0029E94C2A|nr:ABC transporter ATP-binding protein [Pseudomonadota bacterium]
MKLSIENLALSHGERRVLDGVDAVLAPGKVTAILGPADAGKAVLLRALAGRADADAGHVRLGGRLIGRLGRAERARAIALVEHHGGRRRFGRGPADLAAALAARPAWLLAGDPLSALDPAAQFARIEQLRAAADQGMGIVVTLADPVLAARLADAVLLLGGGRMIAFGVPGDALAHQPLRAAFGVEVMVIGDAQGRLLPVPIGCAE